MTWLNCVPDIVDFTLIVCTGASSNLPLYQCTAEILSIDERPTPSCSCRCCPTYALLGLHRTGKQRGRRAGTQQHWYFVRHRLLPCQQPTPASGASGSGAVRPWPAVAAPAGLEDSQLIHELYQPAVPLTNCRSSNLFYKWHMLVSNTDGKRESSKGTQTRQLSR